MNMMTMMMMIIMMMAIVMMMIPSNAGVCKPSPIFSANTITSLAACACIPTNAWLINFAPIPLPMPPKWTIFLE